MSKAYKRAGVDIVKADRFVDAISRLVPSTITRVHRKKLLKAVGGYASLYEVAPDLFVAATTDGVGTKLKLAFESKRHHTVGIDLVAMSVNDLLCVGATPLFFLDYFATSKLEIRFAKEVVKGIVDGCKQAEVALVGGETAEMPGFYAKGEYDLAGFAVGVVRRSELLNGDDASPGDILVVFESSGPHSNGYSLIRKNLKNGSSQGNARLFREAFKPTRIYTRLAKRLKEALGEDLHGLAHITGSGFLNVPRISEKWDYHFDFSGIKPGWIFSELQKRARLSHEEAYTTFNMGFGLVALVSAVAAQDAVRAARKSGLRAYAAGFVVKKEKKQPRVKIFGKDFSIDLKY